MSEYDEYCYIDNKYKTKKFKPSEKYYQVKYDRDTWRRLFPRPKPTITLDYRNLKLTNIGRYSIMKERIAHEILGYIKKNYKKNFNKAIITDTNGGLGGFTLTASQYVQKINSVEILPIHYKYLVNNIGVYGINNVNVFNDDYMKIMMRLKQDIVFADPPWGGYNYREQKVISLGFNNVNIVCLCNKLGEKNKTKLFTFLAPANFDLKFFKEHLLHGKIIVYNLRNKLKSLLIIVIF